MRGPSVRIGSLVPLWDLHPYQVWLVIFFCSTGMMSILSYLQFQDFRNLDWNAILWGDTFCLTSLGFFQANAIRSFRGSGFYTARWWHTSLLILGYALGFAIEYLTYTSGNWRTSDIVSWWNIWHLMIFGLFFYLFVSAAIPTLTSSAPLWTKAGAVISCLLYLTTVVIGEKWHSYLSLSWI